MRKVLKGERSKNESEGYITRNDERQVSAEKYNGKMTL